MTAALILDADGLRACRVGLGLLARQYRRDGLPVPATVRTTLDALERHDATSLDRLARLPEPVPVPRTAVTFAEAAERLGCSRRTVDRLVADGKLDAFPIGTRGRRIPITALDNLTQETQP